MQTADSHQTGAPVRISARQMKALAAWESSESLISPESRYGRPIDQTEMFALVMGSVEEIAITPQGQRL